MDERAQQMLRLDDEAHDDGAVGAFVQERVGGDNGLGAPGRPPVRRQVDHQRRQALAEEHVAVHELASVDAGTLR